MSKLRMACARGRWNAVEMLLMHLSQHGRPGEYEHTRKYGLEPGGAAAQPWSYPLSDAEAGFLLSLGELGPHSSAGPDPG
jgi:hypothetical protein